MRRFKVWFWLIALSGLVLDLWSKSVAWDFLGCDGGGPGEYLVIDGFFWLRCVENKGGVWGIGQDFTQVLVVVRAILSVGIIIYMALLDPARRRLLWALALVLGGAVGNLHDSAKYGAVRDFLDFLLPVIDYRWPTFNIADSLICVGFGLLVIEMLFDRQHHETQEATTSPATPR